MKDNINPINHLNDDYSIAVGSNITDAQADKEGHSNRVLELQSSRRKCNKTKD